MKQKQFTVTGMSCGHCKMAVENAVVSLKGVNRAHVDLEASLLDVEYADDLVTTGDIADAVKDAGYELA